MKDMEFLDERDLKYWEKKAKNGEAVIIHISPEHLLSLNIRDLLYETSENQLNEQEVRDWLQKNKAIMEKHYKEARSVIKENELLKRQQEGADLGDILAEWLSQADLDDERIAIVKEAIEQGVEKDLLLLMIREDLETAQIRDIITALEKLKTERYEDSI